MGIVFVAAVGFGALPGVLALGLHSIGMIAKFFCGSDCDISWHFSASITANGRHRDLSVGIQFSRLNGDGNGRCRRYRFRVDRIAASYAIPRSIRDIAGHSWDGDAS